MALLRVSYREGDWFAVPLRTGGYALGLVARSNRRGKVLGYFFGPKYEQLPPAEAALHLTSRDATLVEMFGDLGLTRGEWPLIHRPTSFEPTSWPVPAFGRINRVDDEAWRVEYSDRTLEVTREVPARPDEVRHL